MNDFARKVGRRSSKCTACIHRGTEVCSSHRARDFPSLASRRRAGDAYHVLPLAAEGARRRALAEEALDARGRSAARCWTAMRPPTRPALGVASARARRRSARPGRRIERAVSNVRGACTRSGCSTWRTTRARASTAAPARGVHAPAAWRFCCGRKPTDGAAKKMEMEAPLEGGRTRGAVLVQYTFVRDMRRPPPHVPRRSTSASPRRRRRRSCAYAQARLLAPPARAPCSTFEARAAHLQAPPPRSPRPLRRRRHPVGTLLQVTARRGSRTWRSTTSCALPKFLDTEFPSHARR